jgi:hypothetical protein
VVNGIAAQASQASQQQEKYHENSANEGENQSEWTA